MKSNLARIYDQNDDVPAFRRFNRMYTGFIGTLDATLLKSDYSLTEARILYELATRTEPTAREIATSLGMDTGYLSRILSKFARAGLVKRKTSQKDSRSDDLIITPKGMAEFGRVNAISENHARALLDGLSPTDRTELIGSMKAIEGILQKGKPTPSPFILRPHRPGDMGWIVHREASVYAEEYGFDETFEALVANIISDFITHYDPKHERCWIAEMNGLSVGHVFLVRHSEEPDIAKLRLLLVEKSARGLGLGNILVNECVHFARSAGYRKITLWTQSILTHAHKIYAKADFRLVGEKPHHSFGKDLIGQTWELNLL